VKPRCAPLACLASERYTERAVTVAVANVDYLGCYEYLTSSCITIGQIIFLLEAASMRIREWALLESL
jgi:hypothetical protein